MLPCLLFPLSACLTSAPIEPPTPSSEPAPLSALGFAESSNQFGEDLWHALPSEGNLVISPASLSLALTMTASGARGETASQMLQALHLSQAELASTQSDIATLLASWNRPRDSYQLSVANRLFGERSVSFEPAFVELTKDKFGAPLEALDFRAASEPSRLRINGWVSEQTRGQIPDLLPSGSIDSDTRLVLTNALYFDGQWQYAFEVSATRPAPFETGAGERVEVPTMHQSGTFSYANLPDVQILELPYAGGDLVMDLVLPKSAADMGKLLAEGDTERWLAALAPTELDLALPKLDLSMPQPLEAKDALMALGMKEAFGAEADFTSIAQLNEPFFIDQVYHQTTLVLDEAGTEASAATAVVMKREASVSRRESFRADRPFLFLLRDVHSGAVLFLGRVSDPR